MRVAALQADRRLASPPADFPLHSSTFGQSQGKTRTLKISFSCFDSFPVGHPILLQLICHWSDFRITLLGFKL